MTAQKIGKVQQSFGAGTEVVIVVYYDYKPNTEEPLYVMIDKQLVPLFFSSVKQKGQNSYIVTIDDFDKTEYVKELLGLEIYSDNEEFLESQVEEEGLEAFIGFGATVNNQEGEIIDFYDNKMNPLFGVKVAENEILIPANEVFIKEVDLKQKIVTFVVPNELIEL